MKTKRGHCAKRSRDGHRKAGTVCATSGRMGQPALKLRRRHRNTEGPGRASAAPKLRRTGIILAEKCVAWFVGIYIPLFLVCAISSRLDSCPRRFSSDQNQSRFRFLCYVGSFGLPLTNPKLSQTVCASSLRVRFATETTTSKLKCDDCRSPVNRCDCRLVRIMDGPCDLAPPACEQTCEWSWTKSKLTRSHFHDTPARYDLTPS